MKKLTIDAKVSVNGKKSIVGMDKPVEIYTKTGVDSEIKEIKKGFIPLTGTEVGSPVTGDINFLIGSPLPQDFTMGVIGNNAGFHGGDWFVGAGGLMMTDVGFSLTSDYNGSSYSWFVSNPIGHITKGISANEYFGANYDDNTYVQKKYVDDNFAKIGTTAPLSAIDTGTTGEIRVTPTFIYTCVATDTWVRAAVETW